MTTPTPAPEDGARPTGKLCLACRDRFATRYARDRDGIGYAMCSECELDEEDESAALRSEVRRLRAAWWVGAWRWAQHHHETDMDTRRHDRALKRKESAKARAKETR